MKEDEVVYCYNLSDATKYGMAAATLLYNIRFWLKKNKANESNKHEHEDGSEYYWTYNSAKAFAALFPQMSPSTIQKQLSKLERAGVLISSNKFNKHAYDKTKWWTMPEFKRENSIEPSGEPIRQNGEWINQNGESIDHIGESIDHIGETIPDVTTDITKNVNPTAQQAYLQLPPIPYDEIQQDWNKTGLKPLSRWTEKRRKAIQVRWKDEYFRDNWKDAIATAGASDFCCGRGRPRNAGEQPWHADIDWFLKNDDNFTKIMEGKYGEVQSSSKSLTEAELLAMHPGKTLDEIINPDL